MDDPTSLPSTLYPKVTNHIKGVVKTLRYKLRDPSNPEKEIIIPPIPIIGTVKLHGAHADILIHHDNTIALQSRNVTNISVNTDNYGFAGSMSQKSTAILKLRDAYLTRWRELNPKEQLDESIPVTIAGEWIGTGVQKNVAISLLSRRFVIISVKINNVWVLDSDYSTIEAPKSDIYNISRGGLYTSTLYPDDQQRTIAALEPLAEKIAARCPFAESFGVVGAGEGLVWKLVPYISDADMWFKTKGGTFKPNFTPAPKKPADDVKEQREQAAELAKGWCSEQRLEQGWDYLKEVGKERNMKGLGDYLKWVQNDVLVEERGYVKEHKVDEQMLRMEIMKVAKRWYVTRYERGEE
jgi:hypothetical protein